MNYGFVIDNRRCIGCHACSTACKQENEVPLGVYRTWVKYVDKGAFPHARRTFQVTRCNHCANPPCVRICPVTAMYQRHDGIVEFDPDICIGCKACLQACPYDAIHIDPATGTAAKCHYCAHRTDLGLEPACVIVCPTQAIISGDLDDPASAINRLVARETVSVRKPEQGTAPKLFYIDGDAIALTPTAAQAPGAFMWAELADERSGVFAAGHGDGGPAGRTPGGDPRRPSDGRRGASAPAATAASGTAIRAPAEQGTGTWRGPIHVGGGRMAEHLVQVTYNVHHKIPWHWQVPAYLVTKAIASGLFMLLAWQLLRGTGGQVEGALSAVGSGVSLVFLGLTTVLLVWDLERPERFLSILVRPQWKSWLTRGAFILVAFSVLVGVWFAVEVGALAGLVAPATADAARPWLLAAGLPLAVLTAVYTAFLFGQAEGRDLWQSPLLPIHMLVQAAMAGGAVLALVAMAGIAVADALPPASRTVEALSIALNLGFGVGYGALIGTLLASLGMIVLAELGMPHASEVATRAAHIMRNGKYRPFFVHGGIVVGHVVPLATLVLYVVWGMARAALPAAADLVLTAVPIAALVGLYCYEHAFVMAPQEVPNS